ncbi:hypothetical protein Vadar_010351 [Vaccinium darrowii]|uniref:Uncharacterized protein n=1 Tax=Vaccinium darrowii TaxID=229202 RepID=A0ACB7YU67_9ERIC|nr:hypothetical protein Vadar_010351 [Vaccinium darrowii]
MVTQSVASSSYGNDLLTAPRSPCFCSNTNLRRHYLSKMDILCPKCLALHWMEERLTKSSRSSPVFGTCCLEGKVKLHSLITPPPPLEALYDENDDRSKLFRSHS